MQSMDGTGMAGSGTSLGRAATAAAAVAVMEVAMVPAISAAMAEGVAAVVAAGIERSSQPTPVFFCIFCVRCFTFLKILFVLPITVSCQKKHRGYFSYMILSFCSNSLAIVCCQHHKPIPDAQYIKCRLFLYI
jgi:hypothetical protein